VRSYGNTNIMNDYLSIVRDWYISEAEIASKIKGYYSNATLLEDWKNLSFAVEQWLLLRVAPPPKGSIVYFLTGADNYTTTSDRIVCDKIGYVLNLHHIYPQTNPINIDKSDIKQHHCHRFYLPDINGDQVNIEQLSKYFPVKNGIDWNSIVNLQNPTPLNTQLSYFKLLKYINNNKNSLLDNIFRSTITVFPHGIFH
jgi:hypothetical protein